jgi:hypothetical protein
MELVRRLVPEAESGPYRRRVRQLALLHLVLFVVSLPGLWLIVKGGWPLVVIPHRSGGQTVMLGFFVVFFLYLASLSLRGAWGALRLALVVLRPFPR